MPREATAGPILLWLCGSIDRDVPAERVQTLLELHRLVGDLDAFKLSTVVQFALAQADIDIARDSGSLPMCSVHRALIQARRSGAKGFIQTIRSS